jgi:hypothetical protein
MISVQNKLSTEYFKLVEAEPIPLKIKFKGKIIPWSADRLRISSVPSLVEGCLYKLYLQAIGTFQEEVPQEQKKLMENGTLGHRTRQESLGATEVEEITKEVLTGMLLRSFTKDQSLAEFPLVGDYKGLRLSGHPDLVIVSKGKVTQLEEWKFVASAKPAIKESYKIQTLVYSYLLQNWIGAEDFPVTIKVFSQDETTTEPLLTETYLYNSYQKSKVVTLLEKAYKIFTGQIDTNEIGDEFSCNFCRVRSACPHNEKDDFNTLSLSFACGPKAVKNS